MFQRGDGRGADAEFPETERHEALRGARVGSQFAAHPGFDTRPVRGVEHHADAALHGRVECVAKVGYAGVSTVGGHGWGMNSRFRYYDDWQKATLDWLSTL